MGLDEKDLDWKRFEFDTAGLVGRGFADVFLHFVGGVMVSGAENPCFSSVFRRCLLAMVGLSAVASWPARANAI